MSHIIEQFYEKYGAALYGMIFYNVKEKGATITILKQVFQNISNSNIEKDPGLFKLLSLARQYTCNYIQEHIADFKPAEISKPCNKLTNDYILQLVIIGRFTISQLSTLLYMEEKMIKQKIHLAVQEFRNRAVIPAVLPA